ncbi:MAG: PilZ domain-containing protein [Candidatus Omnitrophica bacterium]|nr:PilZ domain-containing protein [Candidatus Omnitrophota bacterium]
MIIWEGIDRRKFPRAYYACAVKISGKNNTLRYDAITENVGAGGVCLTFNREFELFETAEVELKLSDGDAVRAKGTIVWVIRVAHPGVKDEHVYDIGIEFTEISKEDKKKLEALVDKLLSA